MDVRRYRLDGVPVLRLAYTLSRAWLESTARCRRARQTTSWSVSATSSGSSASTGKECPTISPAARPAVSSPTPCALPITAPARPRPRGYGLVLSVFSEGGPTSLCSKSAISTCTAAPLFLPSLHCVHARTLVRSEGDAGRSSSSVYSVSIVFRCRTCACLRYRTALIVPNHYIFANSRSH